MTNPQQQMTEMSMANLEKSLRLTNIAISGAEKLLNLQMEIARDLLAQNAGTGKALADIKNMQELGELQKSLSQPALTKTMEMARTVYETATATQKELSKLVDEQVIDFNKNLMASLDTTLGQMPGGSAALSAFKNAVEGATAAYESVSKTSQRISSELAEATVAAVESSARSAANASANKTS